MFDVHYKFNMMYSICQEEMMNTFLRNAVANGKRAQVLKRVKQGGIGICSKCGLIGTKVEAHHSCNSFKKIKNGFFEFFPEVK